MKGHIGLLLVTLGIVLAASFGARNGERHVAYRKAAAVVELTDDKAGAIARKEAIGLPPPSERVSQWFAVGGLGWLGGIGVILVGAVLARQQATQDAAGEGDHDVVKVDFPGTIEKAREKVEEIRQMIADMEMDAPSDVPRAALDRIGDELLNPLVDGRGQLVAKHGLAGFAQYFGPFSAAERNLNRCWSALTDGHAVVAREALETGDAALQACLEAYHQVDAS